MTESTQVSSAVVRAVLDGGNHAVFGAPGSGKSTAAIEVMAALAARGGTEDLLLFAPTRRAAARLREALAARLPVTVGRVLVRTPASFAFLILRAKAALLGEPPPALLTGADQDATLTQLLLGHAEGDGRDPGWPADIPTEALTLATFRHELRDVLMRAAEAGWDGIELTEMGRRYHRPAWVSCGRVLTEYEEVTRLGETTPDRGTRFDVATVLDEAVGALATWEQDLPAHPRPRMRAVVHDDYQDATLATARLLQVLADDGAQVILLGDPDVAVQTFRGAVPGLLDRATTGQAGTLGGLTWPEGRAKPARRARIAGEFGARQHALTSVWRGDERLRGVARAVTSGLPALGDSARRKGEATTAECGSSVRVALARSAPEEARLIARSLREHHLLGELGWEEMAVLVRSSGQLAALRRGLRAGGVPVATTHGELPLAAEPAVRPLLAVLELLTSPEPDADGIADLLLSPIGGMDAVGLRSLRRSVRGWEAAGGGVRGSGELLVDAVTTPQGDLAAALETGPVAPRVRAGVRRLARVLAAGRQALGEGAGLEELLWAVWEATGLAGAWRDRALGTGAAAERADGDLDAVIALFRAAESFAGNQEGADAQDFLAYLRAQEFAPDTLARTGQRRGVEVMTAASAAGRSWPVVVVAGVQEDVWPDLRLRARLLDPVQIADVAAGRGGDPPRPVDARRGVLADEQRVFACAVSRTERHLLVTAVQDGDQRPSHFLDLVDPPEDEDAPRPVTPAPAALDLRGLVGSLRAEVFRDGPRSQEAGALLAYLAGRGVPGAAPEEWWGHAVSTDAPLWRASERVPVRPSNLTTLDQCDLKWALLAAGGEAGASPQAELGTLVHEVAAGAPDGDEIALERGLKRLLAQLPDSGGWADAVRRRKAEALVGRYAEYAHQVPGTVETEVAFDVQIGRANLTGRVDRVEHLDGEQVRIVDLKTSASAVTLEAAGEHPQLAAYQAAVAAGGFGEAVPGGARLVYLGTKSKDVTTREQPAPGDEWATRLVADAAETMSGARFAARSGAHCARCPVRTSCPVRPTGNRVVGS